MAGLGWNLPWRRYGHYRAAGPGAVGRAAAAESACHRGSRGTDGPVTGHPVDDDRSRRGCGWGAGECERPEHAAFYAAEPAGQRDEPAGQLPGGVGEQQAPPGNRQPGHPETRGQHARVGEQPSAGACQHPYAQAESGALV